MGVCGWQVLGGLLGVASKNQATDEMDCDNAVSSFGLNYVSYIDVKHAKMLLKYDLIKVDQLECHWKLFTTILNNVYNWVDQNAIT